MRKGLRILTIVLVAAVFWAIIAASVVRATPDPVNVCWIVTDVYGNPVNGASLAIYYATSASGSFSIIPASNVLDRVASIEQNPIYSGYWNPDKPAGIANADIDEKGLGTPSSLWYYVSITYGGETWIWPLATSTKPGDPSWTPVTHPGSPSGYAAYHPGIGNGPTTAYPTGERPPSVPEFPGATLVATSFGAIALLATRRILRRKHE